MRAGFTLLEIIIGMALISIFFGIGALFVSKNQEREVSTFSIKLQQLAKDTLTQSKEGKRASLLVFENGKIQQSPLGFSPESSSKNTALKTLEIPSGVEIFAQPNSEATWEKIHPSLSASSSAPPFRWAFSGSGLCEPIALKIENKQHLETLSFHALTAGLKDTDEYEDE